MPSARANTKAVSTARNQVLAELKEDHKRVKKAYKQFQKLDREEDSEACEQIVQQVLEELTAHASLEEELFYPAIRGAIAEEDLIDEAEVEHESVRALIEQLQGMSADDEKFAARFTVLCEYVLHHVKEEEGEIFPQVERARIDWESLAQEMTERRAELMPAEAEATATADAPTLSEGGGSDDADGEDGAR